jgi:hypothetical protein
MFCFKLFAYQRRVARFFGKTYQNGKNITTVSIPRHFKIYPNWNFCYENMPSANPVPM